MTETVVMVHGYRAKPASFDRMGAALEREGFRPLALGYESAGGDWGKVCADLCLRMDEIEGEGPVSFVGHSLGGLLIRQTLAAGGAWSRRLRPHRLVMLSPPIHGARLFRVIGRAAAAVMRKPEIARAVSGSPGETFPPARIPFAIVAGGTGLPIGFNPFLPGDNDGILEVAETRDERADGFLRVRATHWGLPRNREAISATIGFLKTGRLAGP